MNNKQTLIQWSIVIIMAIVPISNLNADSPKSKLFELLGISKDASVDEALFDLLVEKLEELGIEEEELSDGYEFMGGSRALNSYINKNAARLVRMMGGELDAEKEPDKIVEKKEEDRFLFEQFDTTKPLAAASPPLALITVAPSTSN